MADNKKTKKELFDTAVFELGLTLIDDYRAGRCRDSAKTLESIVELFSISQGSQNAGLICLEGKPNVKS